MKRTSADNCARYLDNKADYLDYPTALTSGWPIATGIIEGACRYLVKDRMDLTGARWGTDGAEAVLKLRAVRANGDFEPYWRHHLERERQRIQRIPLRKRHNTNRGIVTPGEPHPIDIQVRCGCTGGRNVWGVQLRQADQQRRERRPAEH